MKTKMYKLTIRGNTRPCREDLKSHGWRWDPTASHWWMILVEAHAARIIAGDTDHEFLRGLKGCKKGCQVCLDGIPRWTSRTFGAAPTTTTTTTTTPTTAGSDDIYDHDMFGNPVRARRIPGSTDYV